MIVLWFIAGSIRIALIIMFINMTLNIGNINQVLMKISKSVCKEEKADIVKDNKIQSTTNTVKEDSILLWH